MIDREPNPLRKAVSGFAFACLGIVSSYLVLVGALSVWAGLRRPTQDGFWIPMLAGVLVVLLVLWFVWRIAGAVLKRKREWES